MTAIECQQVSKTYQRGMKSTAAIVDLTLQIEPHQVYGFLGPNGAGKTTTIRMLLDLIRPTKGAIQIFGQPVRRNPAALKNVGALVEGANFYPYLSGWDNLRVLAWTLGSFDPQRTQMLLDAVDLTARAGDTVGKYSTGMKQRLGIAAALLHDPPLVILDEPTNGLDPAGIRDMRGFIRRLVDEEGKTVFLSSHLLSEVQQTCDRVAIIHHGHLLAEGRVDDLLNRDAADQLIIEASPLDTARTVLAEHWQVKPSEDSRTLIVMVAHDDVPAVVRALVAADVDVYGMEHRKLSLEDFFLSVIKEEH